MKTGHLRHDPFDFRSPGQWVRLDSKPSAKTPAPVRPPTSAGCWSCWTPRPAPGAGKLAGCKALVYVYAFTGLRKTEALVLEQIDVDLSDRTVTIQPKPDWRPKTVTVRSPAAAGPAAGRGPGPLVAADRLPVGFPRPPAARPVDRRTAGPQGDRRDQGGRAAGRDPRADDPGIPQDRRDAGQILGDFAARAQSPAAAHDG